MKHAARIIFIAACLMMCLIPFGGMLVCPANTSTENRELAKFPQIQENGQWNVDYLQELAAYFEDHFAFRQELVSADAVIQSKVFGVSNVDTVVVGENDWLYYTASVDDYLGRNLLSERGVLNIAHNLSLIQRYVQQQGASFVFTIAPNKNSLYGDHMPYYFQQKTGKAGHMELLKPQLAHYNVSYVDLFSLFQAQEEILYLKRDSHWNQKGALLVYNALLEQLGMEHDNYEAVKALRLKDEYGDLNKMLYPLTAEPEWNYHYQKEDGFRYRTDTKSVEEAWIETTNSEGKGKLLMFRDSFGNTLLPLMANACGEGYFSRGVPEKITEYMEKCKPDAVIMEKVERNIRDYAMNPPLMAGLEIDLEEEAKTITSNTSLKMEESINDANYWKISGVLDQSLCTEDAQVYVAVSDGQQKVYEAFSVTTDESDYGYQLYLLKDRIQSDTVELKIIVESGGVLQAVKSAKIDVRTL